MLPSTSVSADSIRSSLRASVLDGIFFSIMFGLGESYIGAFGVFLGATPAQIGFLATGPLLAGALTQLLGVFLMEHRIRRRTLMVSAATLQACFWVPVGLIPWMPVSPLIKTYLLIVFVVSYFMLGHFIVPIWTSLLGDLVPAQKRGEFFARRNRYCGIALLISLVAAGSVLEYARSHELASFAFLVIFVGAFGARLYSAFWLSKHQDLDFQFNAADKFSFWQFLRRAPHSNFARYAIFHALMHFSVFLAGPYFTVYMLRELGFSYAEYTLVIGTGLCSNFLLMYFWGKFGDRFGNKRILNACSVGVTVVPVLWLINTSIPFLFFVQIISGFFWAGFQLGASNFLFDAVSPPKRGRCTAYLWVLTATAIVSGSMVGGWMLEWHNGLLLNWDINGDPGSRYLALFAFSGIIRGILALIALRRFREVRDVETPTRADLFFRIPGVHPIIGGSIRIGLAAFRVRSRTKQQPVPLQSEDDSESSIATASVTDSAAVESQRLNQ